MAKPLFDIEAMVQDVHRDLEGIGRSMRRDMREELRSKRAKATGDLIASIRATTTMKKGSVELSVGPTVSYGAYVEFGTKPHWPPRDAIRDWVIEKFRGRIRGPELDSVAFLVQRKIAAKGTPAQPYVEPVFDKHVNKVAGRIANAAIRRV